ncbi:MAG: GNAT family N-acetyltransferase [Anaerolineae bacterium]|jgi:ribosomal protein S18 acetylase RimI-like enzyme|nr:GNAT family N-acetyltransferase [Anaerolineae bacterium]
MFAGTVQRAIAADVEDVEWLFYEARLKFLRRWLSDLNECAEGGLLFAARKRGEVRAALACSQQNPDVYNICGAAFMEEEDAEAFLAPLVQLAAARLAELGASMLTYVGTEDWLVRRLVWADFTIAESVVTLLKAGADVPVPPPEGRIRIRRPGEPDIAAIARVDKEAFPTEWHYSEPVLRRALYATDVFILAEDEEPGGGIIGYAYGDVQGGSAHLTRLAIHPARQGHGVGAALLAEAMRLFQERGAWWITLNTQRGNVVSQRLYHRFGFQPIGQSVPLLVQWIRR